MTQAYSASSSGVEPMMSGVSRSITISAKPAALKDASHVVPVAERQRAGRMRRGRRRRPQMAQCDFVGDHPVPVLLERSPADKAQPPVGPRGRQKIAECGNRIGEKHDAKARDDQIEAACFEAVDLRIGLHQRDVAEPAFGDDAGGRRTASALICRRRPPDRADPRPRQGAPWRRRCRSRSRATLSPGATADRANKRSLTARMRRSTKPPSPTQRGPATVFQYSCCAVLAMLLSLIQNTPSSPARSASWRSYVAAQRGCLQVNRRTARSRRRRSS